MCRLETHWPSAGHKLYFLQHAAEYVLRACVQIPLQPGSRVERGYRNSHTVPVVVDRNPLLMLPAKFRHVTPGPRTLAGKRYHSLSLKL